MGNEQAEIDGLRLLYMLASVISLESIPCLKSTMRFLFDGL